MYTADQRFENTDFTGQRLNGNEYDACTFVNCNFESADLSGVTFLECKLTGCNLSLAKLKKTALKDVRFTDCKLLGLHFEDCQEFLFSVSFEKCVLNHSSFYGWKLKKTVFRNSSVQEVDFTGADLSEAVFDNCDLLRTAFDNTILEKADFRTAFHYSIDPERNRIRKAKFSLAGIAGLLEKHNIEIE